MTGLNVRNKIACILFAIITLASGIYCTGNAVDSISMFNQPGGVSSSQSIRAVSQVDINDAVIRFSKYDINVELSSICKPKHIQIRINFGIKEYVVTSIAVIALFSLLKASHNTIFNCVAKAFHFIILFIHNKDGSKPILA